MDPGAGVLAEDEVHGAFDVALCVDLVADLSEESILISIETDTIVTLLRTVRSQGYSLRSFAVSVLDVNVVECGVGGVDYDCTGRFVVRCAASETGAVDDVDDVGCVRTGVGGVAVYFEGAFRAGMLTCSL